MAAGAQPLKVLLEQAKANYPLLKAKGFESLAEENRLRYEKSMAIPVIDAGYQVNYATYNNITGMATAQHFVPISGPPASANSSSAVWGTAGGLLMNWDIFTFGQRRAKVQSAKASLGYRQADEQQETFQHQVRTAHAYLDLLISHELVKVYRRNLARSGDNLRIVHSLSSSGLRPGVDTALFQAELARARIDLLQCEQQLQAQQLQLAELLGERGLPAFDGDSLYFSRLPAVPDTAHSASHPTISLANSRLRMAEYESVSLRRSLLPKLSLWGTAYGRGSGIRYDGYVHSTDGLSMSRYNYGAGLVVSMPLLQIMRTQYQLRAQHAQIQASRERLNAVTLQLNQQRQLAQVTLVNALKVAGESPAFFDASHYAYKGLLSRYNSGLLSYTDFVQAQYALVRSEADLRKAYVEAWKALLYLAAVNGDLNLFINQL